MAEAINSLQNEKIKNIVKLRESSRERAIEGLFIVEGLREIELALLAKVEIENLYYCPTMAGDTPPLAAENIIEVSEKVFAKISLRENPDGFLALAKIKKLELGKLKLKANPLLIILEAVEKPGNLGAILRTADAAGADAVIINDSKTDIYNPNVIRASQGTAFTVPTLTASVKETLEFCNKNKIKTLATTPVADLDYTKADFGSACAIVLGAEDKGLSQAWLEAAEEKIKINMRGRIDSLNVSVSAAIIVFEALRQRD